MQSILLVSLPVSIVIRPTAWRLNCTLIPVHRRLFHFRDTIRTMQNLVSDLNSDEAYYHCSLLVARRTARAEPGSRAWPVAGTRWVIVTILLDISRCKCQYGAKVAMDKFMLLNVVSLRAKQVKAVHKFDSFERSTQRG